MTHLNKTPSSLPTERSTLNTAMALSPLGSNTSTSSVVALNLSTDVHGTGFFEPLNAETEKEKECAVPGKSHVQSPVAGASGKQKKSKRISTFTSFQDVMTTKVW